MPGQAVFHREKSLRFAAGQAALLVVLGYFAPASAIVAALFSLVVFFALIIDLLLLWMWLDERRRAAVQYDPHSRPWGRMILLALGVETLVTAVGAYFFPAPPLGEIPVASLIALIFTAIVGPIALHVRRAWWEPVRMHMAESEYSASIAEGVPPPPLETAPKVKTLRSGLTRVECTMVGYRVHTSLFSEKPPMLVPFEGLRGARVTKSRQPARGLLENAARALLALAYAGSAVPPVVTRKKGGREFFRHYFTLTFEYDGSEKSIKGIDQGTVRDLEEFAESRVPGMNRLDV